MVGDDAPADMLEFLTVRVLLERPLCDDLMCRSSGAPMNFEEFSGYFVPTQLSVYVRDASASNDLCRGTATAACAAADGLEGRYLVPVLTPRTRLAEQLVAHAVSADADATASAADRLVRALGWGEPALLTCCPVKSKPCLRLPLFVFITTWANLVAEPMSGITVAAYLLL